MIITGGGATAADGVEDETTERSNGKGVPETEVVGECWWFRRVVVAVAVAENEVSDVVPVIVCHSPMNYIEGRDKEIGRAHV